MASDVYVLNLMYHDPFQAIMKSYVATGSDTDKSFLAYMVPSPDEVDIQNMLYLKYAFMKTFLLLMFYHINLIGQL